MPTYTQAELTTRLGDISVDLAWSHLLRSVAANAARRTPGFVITPVDLSDRSINAALLVVAAAHCNLPLTAGELDRLDALLTNNT